MSSRKSRRERAVCLCGHGPWSHAGVGLKATGKCESMLMVAGDFDTNSDVAMCGCTHYQEVKAGALT